MMMQLPAEQVRSWLAASIWVSTFFHFFLRFFHFLKLFSNFWWWCNFQLSRSGLGWLAPSEWSYLCSTVKKLALFNKIAITMMWGWWGQWRYWWGWWWCPWPVGSIRIYWDLPWRPRIYQGILGPTEIYWNLPISFGIYQYQDLKILVFSLIFRFSFQTLDFLFTAVEKERRRRRFLFHIPQDVKNWVSDVRNIERSGCHNCSQFNVNTTCTIAMQCNEEPELAELRNVTDMTDITV